MTRNQLGFGGTSISYLEANSSKKPIIFFVHGNSGSSRTWHLQLSSPLLSPYRLIAFDLPGHGSSGEPEDPDLGYSLKSIGTLLKNAVETIAGKDPYIVIGFSLGTNVIGEMISSGLQPAGIVLISPCIISTANDIPAVFLPNPNANLFFSENADMEILKDLSADCFQNHESESRLTFEEDFIHTRPSFRPALLKTTIDGNYSDEITAIREYPKRSLVIFGAQDKIVNSEYMDEMDFPAWKSSIIKINQASHFVHQDAPEITNKLLADYLTEMFIIDHA